MAERLALTVPVAVVLNGHLQVREREVHPRDEPLLIEDPVLRQRRRQAGPQQ